MTDNHENLVSEGPINHTIMVLAGTAGGSPTSVVKILGMFRNFPITRFHEQTTHEERTSRIFKTIFKENFQKKRIFKTWKSKEPKEFIFLPYFCTGLSSCHYQSTFDLTKKKCFCVNTMLFVRCTSV